jgi:hypothetical protein
MTNTTTTTQIGDITTAALIAEYHHGAIDWAPGDIDVIGSGSHRTVYLDPSTDTVYKIGNDSVNRHEVRNLAELRSRGIAHAPAAHLYEVTVTTPYGDEITCTVVAMPHLPDDGSIPGPRPLLEGAADFNPANVHAHQGRWWLIDAGGL